MRLKRALMVVLLLVMVGGALPDFAHAQDGVSIEFPIPSGPYAVGRTTYEWVDASRDEVLTFAPDDVRDLLATVYYPAEVPADAAPAPYISEEVGAAYGLPAFLIEQIHTQVYADVPAVNAAFPVLIFSPGMGSIPLFYSSLLTELTSQGYVVVALWHPYSSLLVSYPDGRSVASNNAGTPDFTKDPMAELERIGAVWVGDMRFVLDQLPQLNTDDVLLAGRLDLERIGAFGHSFGGATSVQAAYEDERLDAALNMDGTMFGDVIEQGSRVPFLMLEAEPLTMPSSDELAVLGVTADQFQAMLDMEFQVVEAVLTHSANATAYVLENSAHNTYVTDLLIFAPTLPVAAPVEAVGTVDPTVAYQQIVTWVSEFMAEYVKEN